MWFLIIDIHLLKVAPIQIITFYEFFPQNLQPILRNFMSLRPKRHIIIWKLIINCHMQKINALYKIFNDISMIYLIIGIWYFPFILIWYLNHMFTQFQIDLVHSCYHLFQIVYMLEHLGVVVVYSEAEIALLHQNLWNFDFISHYLKFISLYIPEKVHYKSIRRRLAW